ncbi:MAG: sugar phosphate isomerase/epimerase family protein [Actinomycetota bacterium]
MQNPLQFSTAPFFRRPLREAFGHIADAGFTSVEVMVTNDPATQEPQVLAETAAEFGLSVDTIHAPFLVFTRRVFGTEPIEKVKRTARLAREVVAGLVVVHPPYRWQYPYRRWVEQGIAELMAETGVRIAVENMFPIRIGGAGLRMHDGQLLPADSPLVLDTSHAAVEGLGPSEAYNRLGDQVMHIHLSNNAGKGWDSHLPLDQGVLPIGDFLGDLELSGYDGTMSLELDLRPFAGDRAIREVLVRNREFCERGALLPA